jgi:cell division septation protein DedD
MRRGLGTDEFETKENQHDTELTLGPAMLLAIFCGLVLLCGLCFALGYRAGRRSSPQTGVAVTQTVSGQTVTAQPGNTLSKPPAKGFIPSSLTPEQPVAQTTQPAALDASPSSPNALTSYVPASGGQGAPSAQPEVRPALSQPPGSQQTSSTPGPVSQVKPALGQSAGLMVQIAAVSHVEDASVLVDALRKRGYAVMSRREPADNLIHVQIGPFASRSDAVAMSQRLLSDGYNAVVLP